jgi:hypothetical protein
MVCIPIKVLGGRKAYIPASIYVKIVQVGVVVVSSSSSSIRKIINYYYLLLLY